MGDGMGGIGAMRGLDLGVSDRGGGRGSGQRCAMGAAAVSGGSGGGWDSLRGNRARGIARGTGWDRGGYCRGAGRRGAACIVQDSGSMGVHGIKSSRASIAASCGLSRWDAEGTPLGRGRRCAERVPQYSLRVAS